MSSDSSPAGVVSFEEARRIVEEHAAKLLAARSGLGAPETVDLLAARGRVLAEPIVADRDFPPFPRATRDGYAVRAFDVEQVPARLELIGEIRAGDSAVGPASDAAAAAAIRTEKLEGSAITVNRGQAVSIMTGAPLPEGADAVVMVEYTKASGNSVEIQQSVASGENFVPRGAEARAGQVLADRGRRVDHAVIAMAAAVGASRIRVFQRPRVAVLSTGDEVVEMTATPGPAQIRNSNSYSLAAQIEEAGGEAVRLPIASDEPKRLRQLIEEGLACDLLLITGGVSMGKYDLVEQVLSEMKAEFYFTGARIQPGKPIVFGMCGAEALARVPAANEQSARTKTIRSEQFESKEVSHPTRQMARAREPAPRYFFGLPGNPVSTMVTFRLFARPLLQALAGMTPEPLVFLKARLKVEVRTKTGLTRFLPATLSGGFENAEVELAAWQGSGDIAALARANCYLVVPPDRERIDAREWVSVMLP